MPWYKGQLSAVPRPAGQTTPIPITAGRRVRRRRRTRSPHVAWTRSSRSAGSDRGEREQRTGTQVPRSSTSGTAGPRSASPAWSATEMPSGGTPARRLVGASHGRTLHATLVEPRWLPVVVIPATTFPIAPSIAIPVHGPPLEVHRRGCGDIRVGRVVVVAHDWNASRGGCEHRAQADCACKPSKHSCLVA
jgi:hypothetical protein